MTPGQSLMILESGLAAHISRSAGRLPRSPVSKATAHSHEGCHPHVFEVRATERTGPIRCAAIGRLPGRGITTVLVVSLPAVSVTVVFLLTPTLVTRQFFSSDFLIERSLVPLVLTVQPFDSSSRRAFANVLPFASDSTDRSGPLADGVVAA